MSKKNIANRKNWYLQVSGKESGPFSYEQILTKLKMNQISDFDLVKAVNQEQWGTLKDHEIFSEFIEENLENPAVPPVNSDPNTRQFLRTRVLADVFLKESGRLVKVKAFDMSEGGLSFLADEGFAKEDELLSLYCSPFSEAMAFNCVVKVVSKSEKPNTNQYVFGAKFLKVSSQGRAFLNTLSNKNKTRSAS